ncbi:MAG TPA: ABC transporter substrate-binding protein [Rhizomicrobium sp.]|nr:ABC transporter substrate-binding protein [Rhizomicrobium sp.]
MPRGHIAALSFEAGDRNPVVSTIADKVGGIVQIRPSTEAVLSLHPDLVVMQAGALAKLHTNLAALGVPVLELPYDSSIADIRRTTTMLGARLGAPDKAAKLLRDMDATLALARAEAPRPAVRTLIYEPNGYASSGGLTEALMNVAGLVNAAPGFAPTRTGTIPVEEVIAAAPELLILSGERRTMDAQANLVQHHPALAALTHSYVAWAPLIPTLCAGPWSADAAVTFAELGQKARRAHKQALGD